MARLTPNLLCKDIRETVDFYCSIGFEHTGSYPESDPTWVELRRGDHVLQFYSDPPIGTPATPQLSGTLYLHVDDVDAIAAEIGAKVTLLWGPETMDYGMHEFGFRDPNGYILAFTQPADPVPPDAPAVASAATIVPVRDITATVAFYTDILGFEPRLLDETAGFAIVTRGDTAIHLLQTREADALRATANNIAIYIWVRDLDALYSELAPSLGLLPEGRVRPPFEQPYGVREFHVKDPDGCLLFFAEQG